MRVVSLYFFIAFFSTSLRAQTIQGTVTDAQTHKPLYPVTVVNTITQQMVYTDANGFYTLPARQGDLIAFSYIGYKTVELHKPISVIVSTQNISMERTAYELDAVTFRPGHLSQFQLDSIERASIYKLDLQRMRPSPVTSPASALAELFSGKAKRVYQFQKDFARYETERFIDTRYTPALVTSLTGLTGDTLAGFMNAYPMPYDYARTSTNLEMKMWIRDNYKQWLKKDSVVSPAK